MAMVAVSGMATDYTDNLVVNLGGTATSQTAVISLDQQEDGSTTLTLKNFVLTMGEDQMPVGTIQIDNVSSSQAADHTTYVANKNITIKEGDAAGFWLGPSLGAIPVQVVAEQRDSKLYAVININLSAEMNIKVTFGDGNYQIPNSSFEEFHAEGSVDEPNHWHSFGSATGNFASIVKSVNHTFISSVTRPNSTGSKSVLVTSGKVYGIAVANGTITTGLMKAGSMTASNPGNHAEIDLSSTAVDSNGDPFYTKLSGVPDSLAVWVKFKQGSVVAEHPYATVSAAITDGTYYQEPQDKTYNNVVARASNKTITSNGFAWQRISVPFAAVNSELDPKAILVTLSTNADPGQGTGTDSLYVDDLSLIYNQDITVKGITVQGQALDLADQMKYESLTAVVLTLDDFVLDTNAKKVIKTVETTDAGSVVTLVAASEDLQNFKVYTVTTASNVTSGIQAVSTTANAEGAATDGIYTVAGQRTSVMQPGEVYIVKQNGKTTKVVKR